MVDGEYTFLMHAGGRVNWSHPFTSWWASGSLHFLSLLFEVFWVLTFMWGDCYLVGRDLWWERKGETLGELLLCAPFGWFGRKEMVGILMIKGNHPKGLTTRTLVIFGIGVLCHKPNNYVVDWIGGPWLVFFFFVQFFVFLGCWLPLYTPCIFGLLWCLFLNACYISCL